MFDIGAWRRPWIAIGLAAWAVSIGVHTRAMMGLDHPDAVGWALFIGIFPVFFVAVFTHPRALVRGTHARLGPLDAMRGAWPPYVVLTIATLAYDVWVWRRFDEHHVSLGHHLSPHELACASSLCATFFAISTMVQSSARASESIGLDPGP